MKEIKKLYIIKQIEEKKLTGKQAAETLGMSIRQIRRLIAKFRNGGEKGLTHGNRGREPNNRVKEDVREQIIQLAKDEYKDYNDSHFCGELIDEYGISISRSTVRRIRRSIGQDSPRKHRSSHHRSRRQRKFQVGMMLQTDGSKHDWLEGRGAILTLIAYIDDASNEVSGAIFREEEDAVGYFLGLKEICLAKGIPGAVYADRHTIFQSPKKATIEQELSGKRPQSQFGRLMEELGIELIEAQSPQAKGRIERLWGTLQDRLVKSLRKAQASNIEEANQVLRDFLPKFNQYFMVNPAPLDTAYIPWPEEYSPEHFFCFKHIRTVSNDNTISFGGHRLQIPPGPMRKSYAKARVDVWQHLDGQLEIRYQDVSLAYFQAATHVPVRIGEFVPVPEMEFTTPCSMSNITPSIPKDHVPYKPAANHPWRCAPINPKKQGTSSLDAPQ